VGVQVRAGSRQLRSRVAGATGRDGVFRCELPVPERSGATYEVAITWPRDLGGDEEAKSITLNTDRTEFALPFYRQSYA
ncbi:MAG: hypothetical protein ACRDHL_00770, partial [Candidatus Promineifilaceae bacterium]